MQKKDEGGAITLMVAALTVIIVAISSIAIDIGMQRVSRRDMQALADVVALDMVRRVDGRTVDMIAADPTWQNEMDKSVDRNNETMGVPDVSYELGTVTDVGTFVAMTGGSVPDAVRITAESDIDYAIAGGSGHVIRKAVASADAHACFKLGSWAANIDTTRA